MEYWVFPIAVAIVARLTTIVRALPLLSVIDGNCHCESEATKQSILACAMDCFASLAMTKKGVSSSAVTVLKIHHTRIMQMARNISVMPTLSRR